MANETIATDTQEQNKTMKQRRAIDIDIDMKKVRTHYKLWEVSSKNKTGLDSPARPKSRSVRQIFLPHCRIRSQERQK